MDNNSYGEATTPFARPNNADTRTAEGSSVTAHVRVPPASPALDRASAIAAEARCRDFSTVINLKVSSAAVRSPDLACIVESSASLSFFDGVPAAS